MRLWIPLLVLLLVQVDLNAQSDSAILKKQTFSYDEIKTKKTLREIYPVNILEGEYQMLQFQATFECEGHDLYDATCYGEALCDSFFYWVDKLYPLYCRIYFTDIQIRADDGRSLRATDLVVDLKEPEK